MPNNNTVNEKLVGFTSHKIDISISDLDPCLQVHIDKPKCSLSSTIVPKMNTPGRLHVTSLKKIFSIFDL